MNSMISEGAFRPNSLQATPKTASQLLESISAYVPGRSLAQGFYTNPELFEHEVQRIFFQQWLFAGHIARIQNPGDYFLYEMGGESVIIIRGENREVHALVNVCSHRGSRICLDPEGNVKRLVCPYHAWCYDLTGAFLVGKHLSEDCQRESLSLHRLDVRVDEGLIHIRFKKNAISFDAIGDDLEHFFGPHKLAEAKIAAREVAVLEANWKVTAENFMECYHCSHTHPELKQVMAYVRAGDSKEHAARAAEYADEWEQKAKQLGHVTGNVKRREPFFQTVCRAPIQRGFFTQSREGKPVAPLMGTFKSYDGGSTAMQFFPNNWYVANNDYAMLVRFTPLAVKRTEVEIIWLVDGNAKEGIDYQVDDITWLWKETLLQDKVITENNQAGIESRFYTPGPHSEDEKFDDFYGWYLAQIAN